MQGLILRSLRHLRAEKERLRTMMYEREAAATERKERLHTLNRHVRETNRSESRRTVRHVSPWGVDQRQFSPEIIRRKQQEGDELRAQRRAERQLAVELGRTRIGLDFIPELTVPQKKPHSAPTQTAYTDRIVHSTDAQLRRYIYFKRKRDQNREKLQELRAEQKELRREWALEELDNDCKRTVKRATRKLRRKTQREILTRPSPQRPLYRRLKDMLSERIENIRDNMFLLPLSLGCSQPQMDFPVSEENCSTSRSNRRRLKRRAEVLKERYELVKDREYSEIRLWAATVIQRWYRRLKAEEITSELVAERDVSDLNSRRFSLSAVEYCEESGPCSDSYSHEVLLDRFREALATHSQNLESRLFAYTTHLEVGLASTPLTALEESLLSPPALPTKTVPILLPADSCPEPDSTRHYVSEPVPLFIIPDPPEDVPQPQVPLIASMEILSRSIEEIKLNTAETFVNELPFSLTESRPLARKSTFYTGNKLRLELEEENFQPELPLSSPILSPIEVLNSPPTSLISLKRVPPTMGEIEEIVAHLLAREVANCFLLAVPKEPASVDTSPEFLCYFLELIVEQLDEEGFMRRITHPRRVDFARLLENYSVGLPVSYEPENVIPITAFDTVMSYLASHISSTEAAGQLQAYCRMLYESANEALDIIRPESLKGQRTPWRGGISDLHRYSSIYEVFYDVRDLLFAWGSAEVGRLPRQDEPKAASQLQEERLSTQLLRDVLLEDRQWVDYEAQEVKCRLDLTEGVLTVLAEETLSLLSNILQ